MTLKLEAGKTYENGWGAHITIVAGPNDTCKFFRDHFGYVWREDGVLERCDMDHRFNLVKEVRGD